MAQLYLGFPKAAGEAPRQLKGFRRVELAPGESATVTFPIGPKRLRVWSETSHDWTVVPATYGVAIGTSSREFRGGGRFTVTRAGGGAGLGGGDVVAEG